MTKPYIDPTTGQWVGEHETRGADGEVSRQTEWFDTEAEARRFAQTGVRDDQKKPETLAERADSQEGTPIPAGKAVRVVLRDADRVQTDGKDFTAGDSVDELSRLVSGFIIAGVAEGEAGTCEWYLVDADEPWEV